MKKCWIYYDRTIILQSARSQLSDEVLAIILVMKRHVIFCTTIALVCLLPIFIVGCQTWGMSPTPAEPTLKPPIIYTPVPPPPSQIPSTTSTPTPASIVYALTVSINPPGAGTITLVPPGKDYPSGTVVTLTAISEPGHEFDYWGGDISGTSTVIIQIMDSNKAVNAYFK